MASIIDTIRLKGDITDHDWRTACGDAYERLKLDPRCDPESIRTPELIGGSGPRVAVFQVCCDTYGGDVLTVRIVHTER